MLPLLNYKFFLFCGKISELMNLAYFIFQNLFIIKRKLMIRNVFFWHNYLNLNSVIIVFTPHWAELLPGKIFKVIIYLMVVDYFKTVLDCIFNPLIEKWYVHKVNFHLAVLGSFQSVTRNPIQTLYPLRLTPAMAH